MKKFVNILIIILSPTAIYAQIYCPEQIICKGTPESCYVAMPKSYDGSFIIQKSLNAHTEGLYVFNAARWGSPAHGVCTYDYRGGSRDPYNAMRITYENVFRLKPEPHNPEEAGYKWVGTIYNLNCTSPNGNPLNCPFVVTP